MPLYRMKKILLISVVFFSFVREAHSQNAVSVQISNFDSDKGICRACLFNSAASFNGEGGTPFRCAYVPVKSKSSQILFDNVPAGSYAIFVFHDRNGNNKMDKNFLGIPKEGYGASKNKLPFAAAPTFEDNRFNVTNNAPVRL